MPTSILFPHQNAHGARVLSSPIGWPMPGPFQTGKLVCDIAVQFWYSLDRTDMNSASSMISAGLSWRMAIGACVLGNTIMGLVITANGRIGATVSPAPIPRLQYTDILSLAPHTISHSCTHAFRVLLQLLCSRVPLYSCYHLAWVGVRAGLILAGC
jgi:hypothetical protein